MPAFFPADHRLAHVHAIGHGGEAAFNLRCPKGPSELRETYRLPKAEIAGLRKVVASQLKVLCEAWEAVHGGA